MDTKHRLGSYKHTEKRFISAKKKKKIDKFFEEHQRHLWTLKSLTGNKKKKVNYITVNKWFINTILHSETYISIDCGRDQLWVICIQRVKL